MHACESSLTLHADKPAVMLCSLARMLKLAQSGPARADGGPKVSKCTANGDRRCSYDAIILGVVCALVVWPFVYLVVYLLWLSMSVRALRQQSWILHRFNGQLVRLQV